VESTFSTVEPTDLARLPDRPMLIKTRLHTADLGTVPSEVVILRTGFGAPFSLMPDRIIALVLATEAELLARGRVRAGGLWVDEWFDPRLIEICQRLQIPAIVSPRISRSGVLARFDSTRPAFACREVPVEEAGTPPDETPPPQPATVSWPVHPPPDQPDLELLVRTFTRLMSRIPERPGVATLQALPAALDGEAFLPGADPERRRKVRAAMLAVRSAMEQDQRRGESWGRLRRVDWDGDGREEIELESHWLLAVFDPARSGLPTVADKTGRWPLSSIEGEPGWLVARHMDADESVTSVPLEVAGLEEAKDRLVVRAVDDLVQPKVTVEIVAGGRSLEIGIELNGDRPGLIGPELSLLLDSPRIRVDGSEWKPVTEAMAAMGHKFRIADDLHEVVLSSLTPAALFLRPVGDGLVAWAHWNTDGTGSHRLSFRIER
jgi:hypothetical protein